MTTLRASYAWNHRELATLLTLSESLAEVGLEPLTIGPMHKSLTIELSSHLTLTVNVDVCVLKTSVLITLN